MNDMRFTYPSADVLKECEDAPAAVVREVLPDSPAYDAGFEPGCRIFRVNGQPMRDIIDWQWYSADDRIELGYCDNEGDCGFVELEREEGESWGFVFDGMVFDGIKTCRNACTFCFMHQLPRGMRRSLYVRDDDYRLSFLGGTFVTLTNVEPEDEQRILQQRLSPLRVSLHAVDEQVRRRLIGKNAARGLEVFDRLLAAGLQAHVQIVLLPGENDGEVLEQTLDWAYRRLGIVNVGIVPLGFTRFQNRFTESFNNPEKALALLTCIEPFRQRALAERGNPWVFAADEFYSNAYGADILAHLPSRKTYGDFELFEDGIGMIRAFADDWEEACASGLLQRTCEALRQSGRRAYYLCGCALKNVFEALLAQSGVSDVLSACYLPNTYFGGNVDVTGLLCAPDIIREASALHAQEPSALLLLPQVVFNDDGVTLDGMTLEDMENAIDAALCVVSCSPVDFLEETLALLGGF